MMFRKPAPSTAKNRKTRPIDGTARPTFATVTATNEPRRVWPSHSPTGRPDDDRHGDRGARELELLDRERDELAAADLGAAGALALVQDEVDRVAERAEEGERAGHAGRLRVQGVTRRWSRSTRPSSAAAITTHRPPASTTFVLKSFCEASDSPRPPAPA